MKKIIYIIFILIYGVIFIGSLLAQEEIVEDIVISGKIKKINAEKSTVTIVDAENRSVELVIDEEFTVIWKGHEIATIADLKEGEAVELEYHHEGRTSIVNWMELTDYWDDIEVPPLEVEMEELEKNILEEGEVERQRSTGEIN